MAVLLRVRGIATVPLGMHIDEAGLGLNAWSLANFGTDRYGNFMPVCPSNFYGEQSAFYTYFCALFVKLFGLNIYTLRMPGVIMGILTVIFGAFLMKEKWGEKGLFTGLALLGIFPYFIMSSRYALDCNAMLGMLTIALYSLVRLLKKVKEEPEKKHYGRFVLAGILFGAVLYTYIIAAIVIAMFGVLFGVYYLFYKQEDRGLRFKQLLCMAVPMGIMVIPLVLVVCVNYFDLEPIVTPFFSVPKMITNRTEEVAFSLADIPRKLKSLLNVLTSDGIYSSSDRYWTMYWWSVSFVILGIVFSVKEAWKACKVREIGTDLIMLFIAFAEVVMFILCGQYNYHINGIYIALAYFCVKGIFEMLSLLKQPRVKMGCGIAVACLYMATFIGFTKEYFFADTTVTFQVYNGANEVLSLLDGELDSEINIELGEREIYILDEPGEVYLLSNPIPPAEFKEACDEYGHVYAYGNVHFHDSDSYEANHVYVCNKASGRALELADSSVTGFEFKSVETEHYIVFYCD